MEFAATELAALLGTSTSTGVQLIADALNLRHRHPQAWATVPTGAVPGWLLAKVARRCAAVGLIKTHGRWRLHHPDPDTWWWRTPHGHWLEVDPTGTTHHGRDPDLDARLG